MSKTDKKLKFAVLIDADNAQPRAAYAILAEVAKHGTASVRRAYGDWTTTNLKGWKDVTQAESIQPMQQFPCVKGKNATDSAMIIDAMDLLYTNRFDGFCLVSSDSDFTRLASRIRESGLVVYGFGALGTLIPFIKACDKFFYVQGTNIVHVPIKTRPATGTAIGGFTIKPAGVIDLALCQSSDDDGGIPGWGQPKPMKCTPGIPKRKTPITYENLPANW